jgi:hypothetical protein
VCSCMLPWKSNEYYLLWVCVDCLAVPYFSTLSKKWHNFWAKVIEDKMCVLISFTTFVWNISLSKQFQQDIVLNVHTSSCKVSVTLAKLQWNMNFLFRFLKILISDFIISIQWELCFYMQTDRHNEAKSCFL